MTDAGEERRLSRALQRLAGPSAALLPERDGASFAMFPSGDRRRRPSARLSAAQVRTLEAAGTLKQCGEGFELSAAGRSRLARAADDADPYLAQHARIVTRTTIDGVGALTQTRGVEGDRVLRRLNALKDGDGKSWFSAAEIAAAQALRTDWERGQAGLVRGSDWASGPKSGAARGANAQEAAMAARCDADARFNGAMDALAAPLRRIAERVCLHDDGFEALERAENWPARSAKLALKMALAQLATRRLR